MRQVKKQVKKRNIYTSEQKENARRYYLMGLNLHEINKLLDGCPVRTLEKWQSAGNWTALNQTRNIKVKAKELNESGKSYSEIAEILKISRTTVYRYIVEAKETKES